MIFLTISKVITSLIKNASFWIKYSIEENNLIEKLQNEIITLQSSNNEILDRLTKSEGEINKCKIHFKQ